MPDGRTHRRLHDTFYFLPMVAGAALLHFSEPLTIERVLTGALIPVGYALGVLIDPDLDMPARTYAEKLWKRSVVFWPLNIWWRLYAELATILGGHRSFWTHAPLFSTAIRFVWFLFPFILLAYFFGVFNMMWQEWSFALLLGVFLGLSLSDAVHTMFDILW